VSKEAVHGIVAIADWFAIPYTTVPKPDEGSFWVDFDHVDRKEETLMRGLTGFTYHRDEYWCKFDRSGVIRLTNDPQIEQLIRMDSPRCSVKFIPMDLLYSLEYQGPDRIVPAEDMYILRQLEAREELKPLIIQSQQAFHETIQNIHFDDFV